MTATPRRTAAWLAVAAGLVYVSTAGGTLATSDAVSTYEQAKSIVLRGALDVPVFASGDGWRGPDGRYYIPFGIGQPLFDIPFLLAGRTAAAATGWQLGDADALPKAAVAFGSAVAAAITVGFGFLLAWRLTGDSGGSAVAAIALAFGTLLWPYSKFGFNAALAAAALSAGIYGIATGRLTGRARTVAAGGAALGFALLTRHELMLAAATGVAWLAWSGGPARERLRLAVAAAAPVMAAVVVWGAFNFVRFGRPLFSGHRPDFSGAGVAAFLWSPSGALLLYSPVAIAALGLVRRPRNDTIARLYVMVLAVQVAFYASLDDWLGTRSYGPRYLVPLLPLMTAPLSAWWAQSRAWGRTALVALVMAGTVVQLPGVLVNFSTAGIVAGQPPQHERRDDWQWAPVWLNLQLAESAVPANVRYIAGLAKPPVARAGESLADRLDFSLDFWWLYLYYLGKLPGAAALAAGVLPVALAIAMLLRLRRALRVAAS